MITFLEDNECIWNKKSMGYRKPGLKLAITLRHLASGTMYRSMSYGWRVPHNTIALFIPEVCQAIILLLLAQLEVLLVLLSLSLPVSPRP